MKTMLETFPTMHCLILTLVCMLAAGCQVTAPEFTPGVTGNSSIPIWLDRQSGSEAGSETRSEASSETASETVTVVDDVRVAMGFPTGVRETSVVYLEKIHPRSIRSGQSFSYHLKITNLTDHGLKDLAIRDRFGAGLQIESSLPRVASNEDGWVTWNLGDLAPRAKATVSVVVRADGGGLVSSDTDLTYRPLLTSAIAIIEADLRVARVAPATSAGCEDLKVVYSIENMGTGPAIGLLLSEQFPEGVSVVDTGAQEFTHELARLEAGEVREVRCHLETHGIESFRGHATVTRDGGATVESQGSTTNVVRPELRIEFQGDESARVGSTLDADFKIENIGNAIAEDVRVDIVLPAGCRVAEVASDAEQSEGHVIWNLGSIEPGEARAVSALLKVTSEGAGGGLASVAAKCVDESSVNFGFKKVGTAALRFNITDVADPVLVNEPIEYLITVSNPGTGTARDVQVSCSLEEKMEFISGSGTTVVTGEGHKIEFGVLPELGAGKSVEWRFRVLPHRVGDVRVWLRMTSAALKRPIEKNVATDVLQ